MEEEYEHEVFTVYETTNLVTGTIYIGVHKTRIPMDAYLGSGSMINLALKKYGRENFRKRILHIYDTAEEAYGKEAELVTRDLIKSKTTYNINVGGVGCKRSRKGVVFSSSHRQSLSNAKRGSKHSAKTRAKMSKSRTGQTKPVTYEGVTYPSTAIAERETGFSRHLLVQRGAVISGCRKTY